MLYFSFSSPLLTAVPVASRLVCKSKSYIFLVDSISSIKQYVCRKGSDDFYCCLSLHIKAIWSTVYIKRRNLFPAQNGLKYLGLEFFWPSTWNFYCLILRYLCRKETVASSFQHTGVLKKQKPQSKDLVFGLGF